MTPEEIAARLQAAQTGPATAPEVPATPAAPTDIAARLRAAQTAPSPAPAAPAAEDDEGVIEGIARGAVTAPVSVVQGLVELGAIGLDSAFGTNTLRPTTEFFEGVKEPIKPSGTAGKVAEEIVAFGSMLIPVAGWLGAAAQTARGARAVQTSSRFMRSAQKFGSTATGKRLLGSRAGMIGTTALATGIGTGIIAPDGRATLSDSFNALPDALKTEDYNGQSGRAEAARQFQNKLRQAAEATALSGAVDTALFALGKGAREVAKVPGVNQAASATARAVTSAFDFSAMAAGKIPGAQRAKALADFYLSSTKGADPRQVAAIGDAVGFSVAEKNTTLRAVSGFQAAVKKAVKASQRRNGTRLSMEQANADSYDYLVGTLPESVMRARYGDDVVRFLDEAGIQSTRMDDLLSNHLERRMLEAKTQADAAFGQNAYGLLIPQAKLAEDALADLAAMQAGRRSYMARVFEMHQNPLSFYKSLGDDFMDQEPFKKAVRDTMARSTANQPANYGRPEAVENAKRLVLDILDLGEITAGVSPQKAIADRMALISREMNGAGGMLTDRKPLIKLADEMLIARKDFITEVPAVRALMGEIKDPAALTVLSLNKMAETNAGLSFYNQVSRNSSLAGDALEAIRNGARPMAVEIPSDSRLPTWLYDEQLKRMQQLNVNTGNIDETMRLYGYRKMGDFEPDNVFGGRFGDMSGKYVPEELYVNLTNPAQLTNHWASQLAATVQQLKGLSQKMLVVPNVSSRVRDIIGNMGMRVATGNAPTMRNMDNFEALQVFLRDASSLNNTGLERLRYKLDAAGVTNSNLMINQLNSFKTEGVSTGLSGATRKAVAAYEGLPGVKQVMKFFEGITDSTDGYFKATVMLGEEAKLGEALRGAKVVDDVQLNSAMDFLERSGIAPRTNSPLLSELSKKGATPVNLSRVELVAADRTKAMMPTSSQLGVAVKAIDRALPFGNFTSFASENIRNFSNILNLGLKELSTKADDILISELGPEAAEAYVKQLRAMGAQRLAGMLSVAAVAPKAMVKTSQIATKTTDGQLDRVHELTADFLDGHDLVVTDNDGEGKVEYIDLSYVSPYGFVTDAANAALQKYSEKGNLNASEAEQLGAAAWSAISTLTKPFTSEAIVFERLRDVLPAQGFPGVGRGGVTATGAKIYNESDLLGDKVAKGFNHIVDSFLPAISQLIVDERKGSFEQGRVTRAMMNTPGARGEEYNLFEELGRQITGFTPMVLDLRKDFEFSGKEYSPRRTAAKTAANAMIMRGDASEDDMKDAWSNYLDVLYKEQSKLYNDIQAARELGLSEQQIRINLVRKANLGTAEVNRIMRGRFAPGTASDEIRRDIQQQRREGRLRLVTQPPWGDLNRLSRARANQPLDPELFRLRREAEANPVPEADTAPAAAPEAGAAPAISGIAARLQQAATTSAAQPVIAAPAATAGAAPATPPAAVLGGDPVSQARNQEIAARLSAAQTRP